MLCLWYRDAEDTICSCTPLVQRPNNTPCHSISQILHSFSCYFIHLLFHSISQILHSFSCYFIHLLFYFYVSAFLKISSYSISFCLSWPLLFSECTSVHYIKANYVEVKNVFMILELAARVFDVVLNMPRSMIAHRNPKSLLRSSYLRLFSRTHLLA